MITRLVIAILLLTGLALGGDKPCTFTPRHVHDPALQRMSELRFAKVRIEEINACWFRYEDIEERTVSVEPLGIDPICKAMWVDGDNHIHEIDIKRVKKGDVVVTLYCNYCHTALALKYLTEPK